MHGMGTNAHKRKRQPTHMARLASLHGTKDSVSRFTSRDHSSDTTHPGRRAMVQQHIKHTVWKARLRDAMGLGRQHIALRVPPPTRVARAKNGTACARRLCCQVSRAHFIVVKIATSCGESDALSPPRTVSQASPSHQPASLTPSHHQPASSALSPPAGPLTARAHAAARAHAPSSAAPPAHAPNSAPSARRSRQRPPPARWAGARGGPRRVSRPASARGRRRAPRGG
mmetsp:Transcript_33750/g.92528  ORF Transcript_33750/g.92528 Transcript_33750/m.92528 type:complete len:228 (+) Transcript_33750:176-859(+)